MKKQTRFMIILAVIMGLLISGCAKKSSPKAPEAGAAYREDVYIIFAITHQAIQELLRKNLALV